MLHDSGEHVSICLSVRLGAWLLLILNFLFNVSWTTVAISVSVHRDSADRYVLPQVTCPLSHLTLSLPVSLSPVCPCCVCLSGLVACPPCGPGAPVDPGGGAEGGAGHPVFQEEAPPLEGVGRASSP